MKSARCGRVHLLCVLINISDAGLVFVINISDAGLVFVISDKFHVPLC